MVWKRRTGTEWKWQSSSLVYDRSEPFSEPVLVQIQGKDVVWALHVHMVLYSTV
jgi:hypothetical protein